jgi:hypothetical protein
MCDFYVDDSQHLSFSQRTRKNIILYKNRQIEDSPSSSSAHLQSEKQSSIGLDFYQKTINN